jgi:hypothetical protein
MEWRPVVGYEDRYMVSESGIVCRIPGAPWCPTARVLQQFLSGTGGKRLAVRLWKNQQEERPFVHRLVAAAFIGPQPAGKPEVDHLDGDWRNNNVHNLEYVTRAENMRRAAALGLLPRGERHGSVKLTETAVSEIRAMTGPLGRIAALYGISRAQACRIRTRRNWAHVP